MCACCLIQVGYIGFFLVERRTVAVLIAVRVHPDFQRRGIMTLMNRHAELYLKQRQHSDHGLHIRKAQFYNPKLHLINDKNPKEQYYKTVSNLVSYLIEFLPCFI